MSKIISKIRSLQSYEFEHFVADLWEKQGWESEVTKESGDRGIDVLATKEFPYEQTIAIQAKCYGSNSKVSSPEMQKYGSLKQRQDIDTVAVVTTNEFTNEASQIAEDYNIKCINGQVLLELVNQLESKSILDSYLKSGESVSVKSSAADSSKTSGPAEPSEYTGVSSLIGSGDHLKLRVLHLDWLDYTFTGEESFCQFPPGLKDQLPIEFSGVAICLSVENTSDNIWGFSSVPKNPNDSAHLKCIGDDGLEYEPYMVSGFHTLSRFLSLPNGWSTGQSEISPNRRIQAFELFSVSDNSTPKGVTYSTTIKEMQRSLDDHETNLSGGREHIEIVWSDKVHDSILGLPSEADPRILQ